MAVDLQLKAGDFALVDARGSARPAWLADLCCGLLPLASGKVRFLGRDWEVVPRHYADALRGRIGRVFLSGSWIGFLDVASSILLPQLHHTREDANVLRERAAALCCAFGLPGLPLMRPGDLAVIDLARAACVRALLADPALVLLESPIQGRFVGLIAPLLDALAAARDRGAAVIWFTRSDLIWRDPSLPATQRLRLGERGLVSATRTT
ncbi:MAG: organic solvent ABC transporter ATP-binding protein [Acetobacteraceae bacterium]|nr:organic solvent ABC transporter ATP-binding protein [Acetobacteraceae bacterium]